MCVCGWGRGGATLSDYNISTVCYIIKYQGLREKLYLYCLVAAIDKFAFLPNDSVCMLAMLSNDSVCLLAMLSDNTCHYVRNIF